MRVLSNNSRWRRLAAVALGVALLATACSTDDGSPSVPDAVSVDLDAIRWGREAFGPAGSEVGSLVRELEAVVEVVRLEPAASGPGGEPAPARTAAIATARSVADDIDESLVTWSPSALAPDDTSFLEEPAVAAAFRAWDDVLVAAADAVAAARAELDHTEAMLTIESGLADVTKGWEEPGSRSQQRNRFRELADEVQIHLADAQALTELPACATAAAARLAAAVLVAERTAELKGYVDRGQGRSFDEAREEFHATPWHDGFPQRDAQDVTCWLDRSEVVQAGGRMDDALEAVVEALNTGTGAPTES